MPFFFAFLSFFFLQPASAVTPLRAQATLFPHSGNYLAFLGSTDTYRIGDEWGKVPFSAEHSNVPLFLKMAKATARIGGGTGFYLGKFANLHLVATNHHVCPRAVMCLNSQSDFVLLKKKYRISKFFGSWPEIDLALFAIEVRTEDEPLLAAVSSPFDFSNSLYRGQPLVTIGFGTGGNPARQLMLNADSDCVVFSDENEFRLMADPDDLNPGPYKAWSFANGCDVSHGDSGSAMMDRETGQVVGIIWTGRIPKNPSVQASSYLSQLLKAPSEEIWQELSYGVPAMAIGKYLEEVVKSEQTKPDVKAVLSEILQ